MPFPFTHLCDLLQALEDQRQRHPPLLGAAARAAREHTIRQWFRTHRLRIDAALATSTSSGTALLSTFFPERRTDRTYQLQSSRLQKIIGRLLGLGLGRLLALQAWAKHADLGACVERVQQQAEMATARAGHEVTIDEIDAVLAALAARSRFSSPAVRKAGSRPEEASAEELLKPLFLRLRSRDAKWLVRLLLKDYAPVELPEPLVLALVHFLLPLLLRVQASFEAAVACLRGEGGGEDEDEVVAGGAWLGQPEDPRVRELVRQAVMQRIKPRTGVKVGRPEYWKARSINHCLQMVGRQRMSIERKYDGEYCQIHVDLARTDGWLQIFSKSGKDSTADRRAIHGTLRKCLRIGQPDCRFTSKCILEGEMVVYSDKDQKMLEFDKLRKHIPRSGSFLGTEQDSPRHEHEHLMIVFFDLLLLDQRATLTELYQQRRRALRTLVQDVAGRAALCWRRSMEMEATETARHQLRAIFAHGIARRWEGFVAKPLDQPYFGRRRRRRQGDGDGGAAYAGEWIKLKKDYILGLGDTADFAVVGAGFDPHHARSHAGLPWTHFHLACVRNAERVRRFGEKPTWRVIQSLNECIDAGAMRQLNALAQFRTIPYHAGQHQLEHMELEVDLGADDCPLAVVFREPFVFEVVGGGFVRPPSKAFWMLRWPRVVKIHWDRDWREAVAWDELQEMAQRALALPLTEDAAAGEERRWIERLAAVDVGGGAGARKRIEALRNDSSWPAQPDHAPAQGGEMAAWLAEEEAEGEENSTEDEEEDEVVDEVVDEVDDDDDAVDKAAPLAPPPSSLPTPPPSSSISAGSVADVAHDRDRDRDHDHEHDHALTTVTVTTAAAALGLPTTTATPPSSSSSTASSPSPSSSSSSKKKTKKRKALSTSSSCSPSSSSSSRKKARTRNHSSSSTTTTSSHQQQQQQQQQQSQQQARLASRRVEQLPCSPAATASILSRDRPLADLTSHGPLPTTMPMPTVASTAAAAAARTTTCDDDSSEAVGPTVPCANTSATTGLLADTLILLSPCLAQMPYLTQDLIPAHHRTNPNPTTTTATTTTSVFTDPRLFVARYCAAPAVLKDSETKAKTKTKMILLVESHRADATAAAIGRLCVALSQAGLLPAALASAASAQGDGALQQLEYRGLRKRCRVAVYDWRLLECVAQLERGVRLDFDPWRRCWVCWI
ncbi:MAG: hypothetical protein M1826_001814 [Phylliscum demangeonii]|nr:MAG: hypothetical protein M1826_001814 [Phylliscum demangeonii]